MENLGPLNYTLKALTATVRGGEEALAYLTNQIREGDDIGCGKNKDMGGIGDALGAEDIYGSDQQRR
ncbi:Fc.00g020130.m01.CDS01 [Cosmosporella sp. VM-42]